MKLLASLPEEITVTEQEARDIWLEILMRFAADESGEYSPTTWEAFTAEYPEIAEHMRQWILERLENRLQNCPVQESANGLH